MKISVATAIFALLLPNLVGATEDSVSSSKPYRILVTDDEDYFTTHRHDSTDKVEVLSKDRIEKSGATSLNEAVDRMPGVDSQDYCVNCGAKRISINGLRGDHTSVLVDDIPLYSAVTSVYGFDTISMQAIEEIEVKRGTGSALTNPEAIGGSINILTLMPKESGTKASLSYGTFNTRSADILHSYFSQKFKFSVGGEFNRQSPWDTDNNNFSESPWKSRYSFFTKQTLNLSENTQWATRFSFSNLEIIGGNMLHLRLNKAIPIQASDSDFIDGDVRKSFIGDFAKIIESVRVERAEGTSKLISILDGSNTLEWNLAGATYKQTSFYMHAYDYATRDVVLYSDVKWKHQLNERQILTLGSSWRAENLRSQSEVMYDLNQVPKDNLDYSAQSLFSQHEWFINDEWEMSTALRLEHLRNKWSYLGEIDKTVAAPRWLLKWSPNEHLSHYLSYGYGYRMPLTSIESAHGAYDGFTVNITELEKSHSLVYSVSYNTPTYYITPSVHYTHLQNMAFPLDPVVPHSMPVSFVNDSESYDIVVYDVLAGIKPLPPWLLEASFEYFHYPDEYKQKIPTAAIERRLNLRSELEWKSYAFVVNGSWVGARDLSKYNMYSNHFNISDGLLGASAPKLRRSPDFWQWDASLSKKWRRWEMMLSVQNIFNYTQAKAGDTPAMWHLHGNHTHLDNRHVWGPNRGREISLKMTYLF